MEARMKEFITCISITGGAKFVTVELDTSCDNLYYTLFKLTNLVLILKCSAKFKVQLVVIFYW